MIALVCAHRLHYAPALHRVPGKSVSRKIGHFLPTIYKCGKSYNRSLWIWSHLSPWFVWTSLILYLSEKPIFTPSISQLELAYFVFCTEIAPKPQMREKDRLSSHIFDPMHYSKTEEINQSEVQNIVYLLHSFEIHHCIIHKREDTRCPVSRRVVIRYTRDSRAGWCLGDSSVVTAACPRDGVAPGSSGSPRQLLVVTSAVILLRPMIALVIMFQKGSTDLVILHTLFGSIMNNELSNIIE